MQILILCPYWGHEHLDITTFLEKILSKGFDGIDSWIPTDIKQRKKFYKFIEARQVPFVAHQHRATGTTFAQFCKSYQQELVLCAQSGPVLINSHTGKDHFKKEEFLKLLDIALNFTEKTGITVSHETHRGRFGYSPQMLEEYLALYQYLPITADFSHWTCVTESMLSEFGETLNATIKNTRALHARIGYEQGPQIPDLQDFAWKSQISTFFSWWDEIIHNAKSLGIPVFPITTEFGPFPYMVNPKGAVQVLNRQFELNLQMKILLRSRYHSSH